MQRSSALDGGGTCHPQISTLRVDFDRRDLLKSRGIGADEIRRTIRALAHDQQFPLDPIAEQEPLRHRVVGEAGRRERLGRKPEGFERPRR